MKLKKGTGLLLGALLALLMIAGFPNAVKAETEYSNGSITVNGDGSVTATFNVSNTDHIKDGKMKGWLLSVLSSQPSLDAGNIVAGKQHPYSYNNCAHYFFVQSDQITGNVTVTWPADANDQKKNWSIDGTEASEKKLADYSYGNWYFVVGPRYERDDWQDSEEIGDGKDHIWENTHYYLPTHHHSFLYSGIETTITASCTTGTSCTLTDRQVSMSLAAPAMTKYGEPGKSAEAILTGMDKFSSATRLTVSPASIRYFKAEKSGSSYTKGDALDTVPTDVGDYLAEFTLSGLKTEMGDNQSLTISVGYTIDKGTPTITAPTAKTLTYTGSEQELINAGSTDVGVMKYALGTDDKTAPDASLYSTSIPAKADVGTYYVWYKVDVNGDKNYKDTDPACVKAEIAASGLQKTASGGDVTTSGGKTIPVAVTETIPVSETEYTGKKITAQSLGASVDTSSLESAASEMITKGKASKLFKKSWIVKNNLNAGTAEFYAKVTFDKKKAKKQGMKNADVKAMKEAVEKINEEFKQNKLGLIINPADLSNYSQTATEPAKNKLVCKDSNGNKLTVTLKKSGKKKAIKSVKVKIGKKTITLNSKQITKTIEKNEDGTYTITITGKDKNFTGSVSGTAK